MASSLIFDPQSSEIDQSWIIYNSPSTISNSNAGFLFGLGLTKNLIHLDKMIFYTHLAACHDLTSIAILLGLATCQIGTGDSFVIRLISIHFPPLLPTSSVTPSSSQPSNLNNLNNISNFNSTPSTLLPTPSIVQSAALVSLGLVYKGIFLFFFFSSFFFLP